MAENTISLWCQILFSFCYHLAFGLAFLINLSHTKRDECSENVYKTSKFSAIYFMYMALYTLGYAIVQTTQNLIKLNKSVFFRTLVTILTIPVIITPAIYIALLFAASRSQECTGLHDVLHAWFVLICVLVGIAIGLSFLGGLLYICFYGSGYRLPGIGYTFAPAEIISSSYSHQHLHSHHHHHGTVKAPEYQAI